MKSETRANYIFLTIFMLIMGPGLIMLSMKAYKKGAAGMNPPAPQSVAAYNNPNPQNPMLPRLVPPGTASFVDSIADRLLKLQPGMVRPVRAPSTSPLMSEKRSLEFVAAGADDGKYHIALIGWNRDFAPLPSLYYFTATRNGQAVPAAITGYEQQNLPIDSRTELQQYGFILPPDSVLWIILELPGSEPIDAIEMRYVLDGKNFEDRMLFSHSTTTKTTRD